MEAVLFIGVPGSGKSSFYKERLGDSHLRVSLDLLKTRHRHQQFIDLCLATGQRFVVDNTNPTREERAGVIAAAKAKQFAVAGYYFRSTVEDCLRRNALRADAQRVPEVAIFATAKKLELPNYDEGFDRLYYVRLAESGFVIEEWRDDL